VRCYDQEEKKNKIETTSGGFREKYRGSKSEPDEPRKKTFVNGTKKVSEAGVYQGSKISMEGNHDSRVSEAGNRDAVGCKRSD